MRRQLSAALYEDDAIGYRDPVSSTETNTILNSLKTSLMRAYLRGQRTSRDLDHLFRAVAYQNIAMNNAVESVNFDYFMTNQVGSSRMVWANFYNEPAILTEGTPPSDGTNLGCEYETKYGQVILQQTRLSSKIGVITDNLGNTRISSNVAISKGNGNTPISTSEVTDREDYIYSILDGRGDTFWIDDTTAYTKMALDVSFPVSLTTKANVITIDPFPVRIVNIDSVHYQPLSGSLTEIPIPDIINTDNSHRRPLRMHISPVDFNNQLRIVMSPTKVNDGYVYGLSDIDVQYAEYYPNGHFYHDIKIPEAADGYVIDNITSFEAYYSMDSTIAQTEYGTNPPIQFQLMTNSSSTAVYDSTTDVYPLTTSDTAVAGLDGETVIRLKTTMRNTNGATPVLKGFKITYTVKT